MWLFSKDTAVHSWLIRYSLSVFWSLNTLKSHFIRATRLTSLKSEKATMWLFSKTRESIFYVDGRGLVNSTDPLKRNPMSYQISFALLPTLDHRPLVSFFPILICIGNSDLQTLKIRIG